MGKFKFLFASLLTCTAIFLAVKSAWALEGTAELTSTTGASSRCFVSSVLMKNSNYQVLVSCRDLIYPPEANLFAYILWANPAKEGNPIKLGELGVGKAEFTTNKAFASLFVTSEVDGRTRSPSENIIMRGSVEAISFLEKTEEVKPQPPTEEVKPEATPTPSPKDRLLTGLKRAGLVTFAALVALIGLVFFITRTRG